METLTPEHISELRRENKTDEYIGKLGGVTRQRVGQLAGPRKNDSVLRAIEEAESSSVLEKIKGGFTMSETSAELNIPIGRLRSIMVANKIDYSKYKSARKEKKVADIQKEIKVLLDSGVELKTTDLLKADRNLYARAMRQGGIEFWRKRFAKKEKENANV
jgi:hypothetical protein